MTRKIHNEIVKKYQGQVVGRIRIKKPVEHQQLFECAAWHRNSESSLGVFDLKLTEHHSFPHEIELVASLPATVTDDYFQSLWCGNPIGKHYDTKQNAGKEAPPIAHRMKIMDAVERTGNTPDGKEFDVYLDPAIWPEIIAHYRAELADAIKYLAECSQVFQEHGDGGEYRSNLTQLGYAARNVGKLVKLIDEIERHLGYVTDATPMWRDNHAKNTAWAKEQA